MRTVRTVISMHQGFGRSLEFAVPQRYNGRGGTCWNRFCPNAENILPSRRSALRNAKMREKMPQPPEAEKRHSWEEERTEAYSNSPDVGSSRAEDLRLGETVALKFLPEQLARHPGPLERMREAVRVGRQIAPSQRLSDLRPVGTVLFEA